MKSIIWLIAPLVLLILLIIILVPKNTYTYDGTSVTKQCDCFGANFWYNSKCIGFPHNCQDTEITMQECQEFTCNQIIETLMSTNTTNITSTSKSILSSDIVVIMDVSNSMLGAKLTEAKKAATSLILNVREHDRVGIITFSETAEIISNFSNNREELAVAIENISVRGGTQYLPPLILAEQMFSDTLHTSSIKGIIFLSDGVPSDEPQLILDESKKLAQQDIALFTISFGIEGSNILEDMTGGDNVVANRRYKSFTTTESITEAFIDAYQELTTINTISITPSFTATEFTVNELTDIQFTTHINTSKISAMPSPYQCIQGLTSKLTATSGNTSTTIPLTATNEGFSLPANSLTAGNYTFHLESSISIDNEQQCVFYGENSLHPIQIINYNACQPSNCEEVENLLFEPKYTHRYPLRFPRSITSGHVALFVDQSQSMEKHIVEAITYAKLIDNMLYPEDYRSLTFFSDDSQLEIPFTTNKALDGLVPPFPQETTLFLPTTKKIKNLFSSISGMKSAIIITDGQFYDLQGEHALIESAKELVEEDICLTIIGVGNNLLVNDSFIRKLGKTIRHNECGGYIHTPSEKEMLTLMSELFKGKNKQTGSLFIDSTIHGTQLKAWVSSAKTGVTLPIRNKDGCVEPPKLSVSVSSQDTFIVQEDINANYQGVYRYTLPELPPGKHLLRLEAELSNCTAEYAEKEIVIIGTAEDSPNKISVIIILLIIGILITSYEFFIN